MGIGLGLRTHNLGAKALSTGIEVFQRMQDSVEDGIHRVLAADALSCFRETWKVAGLGGYLAGCGIIVECGEDLLGIVVLCWAMSTGHVRSVLRVRL